MPARSAPDGTRSSMTVLNGWKDIARHLGRGVRTAQRWERWGLPIHRPKGRLRGAVFAFAEQLDQWSHSTPLRNEGRIAELEAENARLRRENEMLRAQLAGVPHSPLDGRGIPAAN